MCLRNCFISPIELSLVKLLLRHSADARGDLLIKDAMHFSPSDYAYEIITILLDDGADLGSIPDKGASALSKAMTQSFRILLLLLEYGADVNSLNEDGETALYAAFRYMTERRLDVIDAILQHGVDVNLRS